MDQMSYYHPESDELYAAYFAATGYELVRLEYKDIPIGSSMEMISERLASNLAHRAGLYGLTPHDITYLITLTRSNSKQQFPKIVNIDTRQHVICVPYNLLEELLATTLLLFDTDPICDLFSLPPPSGLPTKFAVQETSLQRLGVHSFNISGEEIRRVNILIYLLNCSLASFIDHEFAHLKNGHIAFNIAYKPVNLLKRRAMEYDADSYACNMAFGDARTRAGLEISILTDRNGRVGSYIFPSIDDALPLLFAVQYFIFRLFEDGRPTETLWQGTHPPLLVRAMTCVNHYGASYIDAGLAHPADFSDRIFRSISSVEGGLLALGFTPSYERLSEVMDIMTAYLYEIGRGWDSIRDDLDGFKRGGNIAPKHDDTPLTTQIDLDAQAQIRGFSGWPQKID